jgi:RNA polymerase sigma factor (sigma-70 family)
MGKSSSLWRGVDDIQVVIWVEDVALKRETAWQSLIGLKRTYHPLQRHWISGMLSDSHIVWIDETIEDVWVKVYEVVRPVKYAAEFISFLKRISINEAANRWRKYAKTLPLDIAENLSEPCRVFPQSEKTLYSIDDAYEIRKLIQQVFAPIKPLDRVIVLLYNFGHLSLDQMGHILGPLMPPASDMASVNLDLPDRNMGDELTHPQLAKMMNIKPEAIRARYARAIRKIRDTFDKDGVGDYQTILAKIRNMDS